MYQQVKSKELKRFGKLIKGDLYLKEGVYTTFPPNTDVSLNIKIRKDIKESKQFLDDNFIN